ncbi:hypothetical protein PsYK624_069470 [Phanerochaete sordida]|uniref:Uncharacterized protein n=1 Tax=Phanerochaete sordida TaxID=48140 RepID=A0A9P3G9J0_9APHY|nr:hypothetical protein PsYK624_069470 [Phanerochaete sordida]
MPPTTAPVCEVRAESPADGGADAWADGDRAVTLEECAADEEDDACCGTLPTIVPLALLYATAALALKTLPAVTSRYAHAGTTVLGDMGTG